MLAVNLAALAACALGMRAGWLTIQRSRLPLPSEGSFLSWEEDPAPALDYDPLGGLLVAAHSVATLALCLLLLFSVNQAGDSPFSLAFTSPADRWLAQFVDLPDTQIPWLSLIIAAGSAGIAAYVLGVLLALPFARWRIRPVRMHLHPDRIACGQTRSPWADIRTYQVDGSRRLVKLYTKLNRSSPTFVLRPPSEAAFREVKGVLRDMLPEKQAQGDPSALRGRWLPALLFCLAMLLALLGAFWVYRIVAEWVWFLYALMIAGFVIGSRLLLRI